MYKPVSYTHLDVYKRQFRSLLVVEQDTILMNFVNVFGSELFGSDENYEIEYIDNAFGKTDTVEYSAIEDNKEIMLDKLVKRYEIMSSILDNVRMGNTGKAIKELSLFHTLADQPRFQNRLKAVSYTHLTGEENFTNEFGKVIGLQQLLLL